MARSGLARAVDDLRVFRQFHSFRLIKPRTMWRVRGAASNTIGNANNQAVSHEPVQSPTKPRPGPATFNVDIPDTTKDIKPERMNPNKTGANLSGIIELSPSALQWTFEGAFRRRSDQTFLPS